MERNGFTLIELVVVVAIMGVLLGIATLVFNSYSRKSAIEGQVKTMYTDLMAARTESLYRKTYRYISVSGTQFAIYNSSDYLPAPPTVGPIVQKTLTYPVTVNPADSSTDGLYFDSRGVAGMTATDITGTAKTICVEPNDPNLLTSIVITATSIKMGTRSAGGACSSANITPK
jgi:prepilin-type N-terminal cleavage/methylation domain-containing protein